MPCKHQITEAHVRYSYILQNLSKSPVQPVIIYRCPVGFPNHELLSHMTIMTIKSGLKVSENNHHYEKYQLEHFATKDTYGLFYNFPITLQPEEHVEIIQEAFEYYPKEDDLVFYSHYPANRLRFEIITPKTGFRIRARYYHPLKYEILEADKVEIREETKAHYYSLNDGVLPFQGVRLWWQYEK